MGYLEKVKLFISRCRILKSYFRFLKAGIYRMDSSCKCLFLYDNKCKDYVYWCLRKKDFPFPILRTVWIKSTKGKYSIVLLSNSVNESGNPLSAKLFDTHDQTIMTRYYDDTKFLYDVEEYQFFKMHFSIPRQISVDLVDKTITEKWVSSIAFKEWNAEIKEAVYKQLIQAYIKYFKVAVVETISINGILTDSEIEFNDFLKQIVSKVRGQDIFTQCDLVKQHGDLTFNNVLYDGSQYYIIDFEHADKYFFLYDLFWIVQNDYIYNHDSTLIDKYLNGSFDEMFMELFQAVHREYDLHQRANYFRIFIVQMYINRIKTLSETNKHNAIASISRLCDKLNSAEK